MNDGLIPVSAISAWALVGGPMVTATKKKRTRRLREGRESPVHLDDIWRVAAENDVHPIALLLANCNTQLARRGTEAIAILAAMTAEESDQWLAIGRAMEMFIQK